MNANPEWLMRQMGYAPVRSTQVDVIRTVGLIAAGVVIGAAAVALFTPRTGPQLRTALSDSAGQLKSKAQKMRGRIAEKADNFQDSAHEIANGAADELRNL